MMLRDVGRAVLLITLVLGGAGGCTQAVSGEWRLLRASPNRETFSVDQLHFDGDGGYRGVVTRDGVTTDEQGAYVFTGFKLKLRPTIGGQHVFGASLGGGRLELRDGTRSAVLTKAAR